jgi:hypothetical protein
MKLDRTMAILGMSVALLAAGAQPMLAAGGLRTAPDAPSPAAATVFGSDLSSSPFPNEAGGDTAQTCANALAACTRVMTQAYGTNGILKAPRNGVIDRIRIIALDPGTARLFLARLDPGDPLGAKLTRKGPKFSFEGQPDNGPVLTNEVDIPDVAVRKGEVLAIRAVRFSGLRGGSGGIRHLEFQPQPPVGGSFETADDDNSFHMLIQAIYE